MDQRNKSAADAAWAEIVPAMDVLDAALAKNRWLAGLEFSVGDLQRGGRALPRACRWIWRRWPHVQAWLARCWDRPAAKKARAMRES